MGQSSKEHLLAELAALCGLESQYYDIAGNLHVAGPETQAAILTAMGYHCQSPDDLQQELARRRLWPWIELVEPVLALSQSQLPAAWNLYLPLSAGQLPSKLHIAWKLYDENGSYLHQETVGPPLKVEETRSFGKAVYGRMLLPLPPNLPLGYYNLQVQVQAPKFQKQGQMLLIIAPDRMHIPEALHHEHIWGITLPLYAIRSTQNWGIGDCGDLRRLLACESSVSGDVIGLNPLHHLGVRLEDGISPYYPTSRCYSSPLYIDLNSIPELSDSPEMQDYLARPEVSEKISSLRKDNYVNYPEVSRLKFSMLTRMLDNFISRHGLPGAPKTDRGREFAAYVQQEGQVLHKFATFLALSEYWLTQGRQYHDWQQWPAEYRESAGAAVAEFAQDHERQLLCHKYAQWLLAGQLRETQAEARKRQMVLGLYLDLAVGVNPGGFDTWMNQDLFALTVNIGAPPDDFSPLGQNWGLAPLQPQQLQNQAYRYFIQVLRQNSPVGGALRIDHVMGLFRLFWIPRGASAAQGAYVRYPAEDMLKIMALESYQRQALVIGEDLGTVPPYIREQLAAYRVLSTRLFYFERQEDGSFNQAAQYPEWAVAAITTHDLPTPAGFWQGRDIQLRQELKLFPDEQTARLAWEGRSQAKTAIVSLLRDKGWVDETVVASLAAQTELPDQVKWGIIAHLAQTPSRLVLFSLEDIYGWLEQQNLPGTRDEHPNWRQKFPLLLHEIMQARELEQVAEIMRCYHRGAKKLTP
jgi:4-alpha-glucanotransferase